MSAVTKWWARVTVLLLVGIGAVLLAYHLRAILNPLLAALAIAYALNPLVVKLSTSRVFGKPMGRTAATVLIFVAFLGAFGGTLAIAIPLIGREVATLAGDMAGEQRWDSAEELIKDVDAGVFTLHPPGPQTLAESMAALRARRPEIGPSDLAESVWQRLARSGRTLTRETEPGADGRPVAMNRWFVDHNGNGTHDWGHLHRLEEQFQTWTGFAWSDLDGSAGGPNRWSNLRAQATEKLQERSGELAATGFSAVGWVGGAIADGFRAAFVMLSILVLIPFYTFFFMRGLDQAAARAIPYIPAAIRPKTVKICTRIHLILSAFIRGRAFIAIVVSVMAWLGFWACGVPYSLVLGLLVGLTIMVPFLPVVVAVIPACLLLLAEGKGFGPVAGVIVVYSIIQTVEGFVLTPRVLGEEGDMHPVTAFVAVFVGAELLGLLGAMLAIPLAATVKIIMQELLMPELKEVAGIGPGTETGKTQMIIKAAKAETKAGELVGGGGLVPHPLDDKPAGDTAPAAPSPDGVSAAEPPPGDGAA